MTAPIRWLVRHRILCLILFSSFVARLFLADWNSYWFDEILSVARYGTDNPTIASALKTLASQAAHPPLLVVAFPHNKPARFPEMMRRLRHEYDLVANQLSANGRGYMVWKKRGG